MAEGDIDTASVATLIRAVGQCEDYAFLIGAGTSRPPPAEIPTGGELIETWQEECYKYVNSEKELEEWAEAKEKAEKEDGESSYGFWFEECHPTRGGRKEYVKELVADTDPNFEHVLLASLMDEGYVPHVLTPNFDDLLFDAFYLYLEDKPQVIDHRAVTSEFRLTNSESSIVKLHGDYLYDNLRNTDEETRKDALDEGMKEVLQQTAEEYGLVVVGYSGGDESIMDPLIEADLSEYGIYWCTRDVDSFSDEEKAEELLEQPNTYLVEIEGFGSLMRKFGSRIDDVEPPQPEEITDRAEERAEMLRGALEGSKKTVADDEEEEYVDKMERFWEGNNLRAEGDYEKAINCYTEAVEQDSEFAEAYCARGITNQEIEAHRKAIADYDTAIELNPEYTTAYYNRGTAKHRLGEYEEAIKDYDTVIEIDPEYAMAYAHRGAVKQKLESYEEAIADFDTAIELDPENDTAYQNHAELKIQMGNFEQASQDAKEAKRVSESINDSAISSLLHLIPRIVLNKETSEEESKYRTLCMVDFTTTWDFEELDSWLAEADLEPEKEDKIAELIDLLRDHKETPSEPVPT